MADEKCHDEAAYDNQIRFKTCVYIVTLDAMINQMDDRWTRKQSHFNSPDELLH